MKPLFLACSLFFALSASSQDFYVIGYGGLAPKNGGTQGTYGLSVGGHITENWTAGVGAGWINYEEGYIPVTLDFSYTYSTRKISPMAIIRGGYGMYSLRAGATEVKGGPSGTIMAGIAFPVGRNSRSFVMGGYSVYSFTYDSRRAKDRETDSRFSVVVGFKI